MRAFILLCCLVASTQAEVSGYNYQRHDVASNVGNSYGNSYVGHSASGLGAAQVGNVAQSGLAANAGYGGFGVFGGQSGFASHGGQVVVGGQENHSGTSEYNKEFYSYSAPESEFNDAGNAGELSTNVKKNLRVIFIKGPENSGLEHAALQLAKSASQDKTAIYVLNKQADISQLAEKLRNVNTQTGSKPEVHFIKYRSEADAEYAKKVIQSKYESLHGTSSSHDGGVVPVHDYVSKSKTPSPSTPASTSSNSYLPPNLRT